MPRPDAFAPPSPADAQSRGADPYRLLFERSPLPMWVCDPETLRFLAVNDAAVRHYGYSRDEFLGMTVKDIRPPEDVPKLLEAIVRVGPALGSQGVWRHRRRDGTLIDADVTTTGIEFDGRPALLVVVHDVTERRQMLERLTESEQQLRAIFETEPECVKLLDRQGRLLNMNPAGLTMIEAGSMDEVVGRDVLSIVAPEHRSAFAALTQQVFDGKSGTLEFEIVGLKGTRRWLETHAVPLPGADGRISALLGVTRDITIRKRAEGALARSRAQLRRLTARLEAVREEERTRIAREIHDQLGQALTALKMDLAWLRKKPPRRAAAVARKLREMDAVIDGTIEETHRLASELRPRILDDLGLPAATRWLAEEFQRRSTLRCDVQVTSEEPRLGIAQATAVFRILQEALTNVVRHARASAVEIRCFVVGDVLELFVRDDGRGITPAEADDQRSLGLLGIRERALTWSGEVLVRGEPGRGTTLRLIMPIAR